VPCTHKHNDDVLVPIGEAAKILGVSISTLRRWDRDGLITTYRTPGGQRRYRLSDLIAAIGPGTPAA
jgi:excisionase family DNA binding protein